ncbi:MAG: dihydrofolate reductase [Cytophagaceae bacterium]|nr:dihydrofolate reductase [Cytophagaceae bacterium]
MLFLIAAVARNGAIGKDNQLLWHLPADLQHFKRLTTGHAIVMGRKTYESIGRPLPNRTNIVVTRQANFRLEGCVVAQSLEAATANLQGDAFVIVGGELYQLALPLVDKIYLTEVQAAPEGDTFFPTLNLIDWQELSRTHHPADERHAYAFDFVELERCTL